MTTALLTLGRLPKGLEVARALAAAGVRVEIAEPFRWHLSRVSRAVARSIAVPAPNDDPQGYFDAMAEAARGADVVVPVSEEVVHAAALAGRVPARWFGMDRAATLALHDKGRFAETARALGLAVPRTAQAGTAEAAALLAAGAVAAKPALTCSGQHVRRIDPGEPPPRDGLVQAWVEGRPLSTFTVAWQGRVIGTACYRPTVLSGTVAIAFEPEVEAAAEASAYARRFVEGTGASGFVSLDLIAGREGLVAIECNPRLTSGVHFVEHEDLAAAILDPASAVRLRLRGGRYQQAFPVLTEWWAQLRNREARRACRRALWGAREVSWGWADPLPLLLQPLTAANIIARSIREGTSFGAAATRDIAWFGD